MSQSGDARAEPASGWGSSLGVVAGQRSRQRPVTITSRHGAQQVPIAVTSRHHPHRHHHTQQVSQTSGLLNRRAPEYASSAPYPIGIPLV